ncbi:hypothetical protein [Phenylobacterium sp.]|uniref:hypothetical protein n=1 Tax=Phenylobacterium sp. TaxID=1871053 RepID=UPI002FE2CFF9
MNPIRPSGMPAAPAATHVQRPDAARLEAQKAFFELAFGRAPAPNAVQTVLADPAAAATRPQRTPQASAEPPAKILRPGSLLDIRV